MSWLPRWRRAPNARSRADEREARAAEDALIARARALPREAEPQRDLWIGVRNRIEAPPPARASASAKRAQRAEGERSGRPPRWRARMQVPVWAAGAAALLLVATTLGTGLWLARAPALEDPAEVRAIADSLRDRDGMSGMREDLLALLDERRAQLPPDVVAAVEKNLAEIDRAIAEIHLAFEEHPNNSALKFLLAETYRREAEILEQLEWWTRATGPGAHS